MVTILPIDIDHDLIREGLQHAVAERLPMSVDARPSAPPSDPTPPMVLHPRLGRVCTHPLTLSPDRRWASCDICQADWPASVIPPDAIVAPAPRSGDGDPTPPESLSDDEVEQYAVWASRNPNTDKTSGTSRLLYALAAAESALASQRAARARAEEERQDMRDALRRVGIGTSDACGDEGAMVEWFATTEQGEQGCGTLDEALEVLTNAAKEDGRREARTTPPASGQPEAVSRDA